jgi:peptide/nickel transport system substrate-binding protein
MSPVTRRSLAFGAAMMLGATAIAAPVAAQDEPPQGGTVVVGEWQAATQLNPYLTNALRDFEAMYPVSRGLATIDGDGQFIPEFITEYPSAENGGVVLDDDGDGFTINVTLMEGLTWSDGEPITMEDWQQNYDWAVATGAAGVGCPYCNQIAPIIDQSIEGEARWAPENLYIDDVTISEDGLSASIHFSQNYAGWSSILTQQLIAPQYWLDVPTDEISQRAVPGSDSLLEIPVNGPFVVDAASSEGIDYVPNDAWTADAGPNLDELRLRFYGSKDGEFTAFLNGEIDLTLNTTLTDVAALQSVDPSIGQAEVETGWLYEHLDFNTERADKGLDDPDVRRALRQAIDKQTLVDVLFPGAGLTPACSISPPTVWWASEVQCDPYDPEAAAAALDAAGWVEDPDLGTRAKDGMPMRLQLCTSSGNPTRLTTLGRIAQDWGAIGVATDIQTQDPSLYFGSWEETTPDTACNIYRGNFDVSLYTSQLSGDPYGNYYFNYHSTQPGSESNTGGTAITRLADPGMDAALEELGTKVDPEGIIEAADAVHQIVNDLANEVPLYYRPEPIGVSNRLGGYVGNPSTATKLWDVENWYVQQ